MLLRKELLQDQYILSMHQTIKLITQEKKIFLRLSDGELPIFHKKSGGFHSYSKELHDKLLQAYYFALGCEDFLVGVNPNLIYPFTHINDHALIQSCKNYQIMDFLSIFPLKQYGNALLLRTSPIHFYHEYKPLNNIYHILNDAENNPNFYFHNSLGKEIYSYYKNNLIAPIKKLWENKHIILCEGKKSYFGTFNDLFDQTKSIHRIHASNHNAFADYSRILEEALALANQYSKNDIFFVCALGHTSKLLLTDLYREGFKNGIDAGNFSIAYDSFLHAFPMSWIDDPIQTSVYPPIYYGRKLKAGGTYA